MYDDDIDDALLPKTIHAPISIVILLKWQREENKDTYP